MRKITKALKLAKLAAKHAYTNMNLKRKPQDIVDYNVHIYDRLDTLVKTKKNAKKFPSGVLK